MGRTTLLGLLAGLSWAACAAPPLEQETPLLTPSLEPAPAVSAPHAILTTLAGDWDVTVVAAGLEAPLGVGAARLDTLHGGRFLRLAVSLDLDGQELTSTGHLGYDEGAGEWQVLWLSDLTTGLTVLSGRGDPRRGVHLRGERAGVRGRSVWRVQSDEAFTFETFGAGPDGRDRLLRTSRYVRR